MNFFVQDFFENFRDIGPSGRNEDLLGSGTECKPKLSPRMKPILKYTSTQALFTLSVLRVPVIF